MDQHQLDIVRAHPLGAHLDAVRASLYEIAPTPADIDAIGSEELQNLCLDLLSALRNLSAIRQLPSASGVGNLRQDLLKLTSAVASNTVNYGQIKPLLDAVLTRRSDVKIWEQVYHAVTESTPPRKPVSSFLQTPSVYKTSSVVNSSEFRVNMDKILRDELGVMYVDVPNFHEAFFGYIPNLKIASTEIFQNFTDETPPRFQEGCWTGWPENANQNNVLAWLADLCGQITERAQDYRPRTMRRPLVRPNNPLDGSVAKRKPDFAFVDGPTADYDWSHILIPGELKSNPKEDIESQARLDVGRYVREVFTAQPTRRFVLAFTLCGCWMRLWEFDRLGGIASTKFDIHQEGRLFVSTILGFLCMDDKSLGFDPTIIKSDNQQYIDIERDGTTERLIIDGLMRRTPGVVGRATTCWKAHPDGDKTKPLVIKDSWQFPEREDEGELLKGATEQEVKNVARYYTHATVCVGDDDDDIQGNVRKGLDVTKASNYGQVPSKRSRSDLAIKIDRQEASGAKEKTGTRAFMAIGVLSGDHHHSFMDDLESFYWVLLWICIHYDGEGQGRRVATFDEWNSVDTEVLIQRKQGTLSKKVFNDTVSTHFTTHYRALIPWVSKLRDIVFPNGESWEKEDITLYSRMRDILSQAQHDSSVAAVG
ncbi:hypothetical protein NUW58_g4001 [Xylaria curta]|uniref:Uncharacterized protein n=1 Tax=Xylaria curta TaxID=42375 RepID=A0ACC1PBD5_9PEZI|nr:hypothetical protein NUW58_g4001 [Xylaria curta]